jgi:uncharacterized membrane protein YkvA (DUF1232 family)
MSMRKSNRAAAGAAAWQVVHDGTRPGRPSLWARIGAVPRMLGARMRGGYTQLSTSRVVAFAAALLYILSPIDAVPEVFVPFIGLADDVGVAAWLAAAPLPLQVALGLAHQRGASYVQGHVVG